MTIRIGKYTLTLSATLAIVDAVAPKRIEIDEQKRREMYEQITQSETFAELKRKAAEIKAKRG